MVQKYIEEAPGGELTNPVGTEELPVTNRVTDYFIKIKSLILEKLRDGLGTVLTIGTITDGELLKRSGTSITSRPDYAEKVRETGGPTTLDVGAIADGELLKRSGTSITSRPDYAEKIRETGGPTTLNVGAVSDGQFLKRSGTTIVGDTPSGGGGTGITNYVITPSIATSNLTVAIKTLAGTDPSSSDPITIRIGNAERSLEAALSVTVNAGTNTFTFGSSELAGHKTQLFVYLGWRASDSSMFIGLSAMPYGKTYADFSGTAANQAYLAYSGSAPASTDPVTLIGRIDVQNSGSASYNWSLPTGAEVVNFPIFNTDWLDFTPTRTGYSVVPTNIVYKYTIDWKTFQFLGRDGGDGTSNANTNYLTLPFYLPASTYVVYQFVCACNDNTSPLNAPSYGAIYSGTPDWKTVVVGKDFSFNATSWTTTGGKRVRSITGFAPIV